MRIAPIGQYRFTKLPPQKTLGFDPNPNDGITPMNQTLTQSDLSLSTSIDGGDPDAAKAAWEMSSEAPVPGKGFEDTELHQQLTESEKLTELYGHKIKKGLFKGKYRFSASTMSLPEALIAIELLNETLPKEFTAKMKVDRPTSTSGNLKIILKLQTKIQELCEWQLHYNILNRHINIYKNKEKIGHVKFVIRGYLLEEIQGNYNGNPLLLDPIWNPRKPAELREEHFRYKAHNISLIYKQNEKYSVQNAKQHYHAKTTAEDLSLTRQLVTKTLSLNKYEGKLSLLYLSGILTPIALEGTFKIK